MLVLLGAVTLNSADLKPRILALGSNQRYELALDVGVAVDVPLGCQ